ncbi:hypothetical protein NKJ36_25425 [Mesorhizobium sp. M0142]|uniref:hypothetical protein n=1 Tax=unclassified Mesorhizobium TaxID=325217 RepID=UPI0003CEE72A|nr:hypothetical protein [Mesorhizobium sp. LSHC420B00]ESX63833.1 hypothetical protein X759_33000 [Mesorhizobium sp. LSHC420B00]
MIEVNMIAGMGHGTPLGNGLGAPGPFMLDVGISSTQEIARFWGILVTEKGVSTTSRPELPARQHVPSRLEIPAMEKAKTASSESTATLQSPRTNASGQPGVKNLIEHALRTAGLMR